MYTREEYEKRANEIRKLAFDLIMNKRPDDVRKIASEMIPEDAYILGMYVGTILQSSELAQIDESTRKSSGSKKK